MTSLLALPPPPRVKRGLLPWVPDPKGGFPGLFERHGGNFQVPSAHFLSITPGPTPASLPRPYSWPRPSLPAPPVNQAPIFKQVLSAQCSLLSTRCSVLST